MAHGWLRVPVGSGSEVWSTVPASRKVLVVAHTVASTARLLDVLGILENDLRVQVLFTPIPASAFDGGVEEFLADIGGRVVSWEQAVEIDFDLVLSAGHSGDLYKLSGPILLMPHGIGYNKYLPGKRKTENGKRKTVYGLASEQLLHEGRLVPAAIVLSHDEQLRRLKRHCPEAVVAATVAGDLCLDRMTAGLPWRERYRRELGVRAGQRLVVVSSTWGSRSLFGRHPELPARMLAELPADEYRVAAVVHPNVWHGDGAWQVRTWLADARRAGLLLIPPREGWRAALVASDCVIGDHGSVTLYGAALGRPALLAGYGAEDIDAGTAMAALAEVAPHLDPGSALRDQVDAAMCDHDPVRAAGLADLAVAVRGRSAHLLRGLMYRLMGLDQPAAAVRIAPVPPAQAEPVEWGYGGVPAMLVAARIDDLAVRVERYPAALSDLGRGVEDPHLVVDDGETDDRLRQLADVLVRRPEMPGPAETLSSEEVFAGYPCCQMLADVRPSGCLVRHRGGGEYSLRTGGPELADPGVLASVAFAWLGRGQVLPPEVTLRLGQADYSVRVTVGT